MRAAAGLSSLIGLQVFTRVLTFALNTALARNLGPSWYALANVQLQLLTSTALFLSREGLRRACQRVYPGGDGAILAYAMNLAWLSVPLTGLAAGAAGLYSAREPANTGPAALMSAAERTAAVWMVCAAAVIEAFAEPGWVYAQVNGRIPVRAAADGAALTLKVCVTYWLALVRRQGALAFGAAQLVYAIAYVVLLYASLGRSAAASLRPRPLDASQRRAHASGGTAGGGAGGEAGGTSDATTSVNGSCGGEDGRWLSARGRSLGLQYCYSSLQKYALTEGERVVLVALSPLAQQGVFALVSNLCVAAIPPPTPPPCGLRAIFAVAGRTPRSGGLAASASSPPPKKTLPPLAPSPPPRRGSLVARLLLAPLEEIAFASFSREAAAGPLRPTLLRQLHALLRAAAIFGGLFVAFGP